MKNVSGKQLAKTLEKKGWILKRINGSHHIYMKPDFNMRLTIPIHANKPLKIGLLKSLIKAAGITENDL